MFYYFITGSSDVFEREESVDASVYPQFTPLTDAEIAVHIEFPTYNKEQIRGKVEADNAPVPDTSVADSSTIVEPQGIDVSAYKQEQIDMLSFISLDRGSQLMPSYKVLDAYTGVYDASKSADTIAEANRIYTMCRNEFYRLRGLIESASTVQDVNEIVATNGFDSFV